MPPAAAVPAENPLEAPDCDLATGRIRIPSNLAPNCVPPPKYEHVDDHPRG